MRPLSFCTKMPTYTVLGDLHQTIEKTIDRSLYDDISEILNKRKTVKLSLNKGYRSTREINTFTQKLLGEGTKQNYCSFERHGEEPMVLHQETFESIDKAIIGDIASYTEQGYESIAVICKTQDDAEKVYCRLGKSVQITLIKPRDGEVIKGALVIPSYMAKGLEFDVVIVYDVNKESYSSDFDKKLLYIACTRALHRLVIYYKGDKKSIYLILNFTSINVVVGFLCPMGGIEIKQKIPALFLFYYLLLILGFLLSDILLSSF